MNRQKRGWPGPGPGGWGGGTANKHRFSFRGDENILELGGGCTTLRRHWMPLNYSLLCYVKLISIFKKDYGRSTWVGNQAGQGLIPDPVWPWAGWSVPLATKVEVSASKRASTSWVDWQKKIKFLPLRKNSFLAKVVQWCEYGFLPLFSRKGELYRQKKIDLLYLSN